MILVQRHASAHGRLFKVLLAAWLWAGPAAGLRAAEPSEVPLPPPDRTGGKPLQRALDERKTTREFTGDPLEAQALSDLLWAAFGVNREGTGGRTAPSAMNSQEIDVYVATRDGLFLYDAKPHRLRRVLSEDIRHLTSG